MTLSANSLSPHAVLSHEEVAALMGLSKPYVAAIEARALRRLRKLFEEHGVSFADAIGRNDHAKDQADRRERLPVTRDELKRKGV
jgi:hypothetical protein